MPIDATAGGPNSNSYGTLVEADAYFTDHPLFDTWDAITDPTGVLIHATRKLELQDYIGDRATTTQALSWPRVTNDSYDLAHDDFPYASNVVPTKMKYAQFEMALWLAQTGGTVASGTVEELQIGNSVRAKFATGSVAVDTSMDRGLPIRAAEFLKGLRLVNVLA